MSDESALRQMYFDGQCRWPLVKLAFEVFASHCTRVLAEADFDDAAREAADLYLCCACVSRDSEALRTFQHEGLAVAKAAISRIARDPDFIQETLQEVWDKLLVGPRAKVAQYCARGPLKAWIRVTATRVALDRWRSRGLIAARQVELTDRLAAHDPSPEMFLTKARFGRAFQQALRHAVAALSAQDRNVLRMHLAGRCTIDEIGRAYNVHRATAARWLDRCKARIYEFMRRELCSRNAKLTASEFKSLAHLIGSELELSLTDKSRVSLNGPRLVD